MENSDYKSSFKKLFDNPDFIKRISNFMQDEVKKCKVTDKANDVNKNVGPGLRSKRPSFGYNEKRPYKRKKMVNQSFPNNDFEQFIKSTLQDDKMLEKIVPHIDESRNLQDNLDNSADKQGHRNTRENTITISKVLDTNKETRKLGVEKVVLVTNNVKTLAKPRISNNTGGSLLKQDESKFHTMDGQSSESVLMNEKVKPYTIDPGDGVVDNQQKSDLPKKDGAIISVSVETVNNNVISTQNTTPMHNCPSIEQETDLNNLHNEENFDVSQSDDYYYLNMANSGQLSVSDYSETPEIKSDSFNILDISNSDNSANIITKPEITNAELASTSEAKDESVKAIIKSNENVEKTIRRSFTFPSTKKNGTMLKTISSQSIQGTSKGKFLTLNSANYNGRMQFPTIPQNYHTILVKTDTGVKSVLQSSSPKITVGLKTTSSKPVIKSNERVNLCLRKSVVDHNIVSHTSPYFIKNNDSLDSLNLPKIESVHSIAKGLPKITSVTSCAPSFSNTHVIICPPSLTKTENAITCPPSLQRAEDIISAAERISPDLINTTNKILKIPRKVTKVKGQKKLRPNILHKIENTDTEMEKEVDSFNRSSSIDATIEEVIAKGLEEKHDTHSVVSDEKILQKDIHLHINGLGIKTYPRKGLKVLKPVKKIDCINSEVHSATSDFKITTVESIDNSGLPSIKNVVSLATSDLPDEFLKETNEKLSSSIDISTNENSTENKHEVLESFDGDDNGFEFPDDLCGNWNFDTDEMFNNAANGLMEEVSRKKSRKKSPVKSPVKYNKLSPPFPARQLGASNGRNKGVKVLKPVRKQNRGRAKNKFGRQTIKSVQKSIENSMNDADVGSINFADLSLVDTESTFVKNEDGDAPSSQSTPHKIDILSSKLFPTKSDYDDDTNCIANDETEGSERYIADPPDNSRASGENVSDYSMGTPDDCEELLEEVPLQQRRCNNFYVKIPTGEELGTNIDLAEYEKFFSIHDESDPSKIRKTEIESLDNDEELPGSPSKRRSKCSKCDKTFVNSVNRKIHEATCENNELQSLECSKCGRLFNKAAYRKIHEKKCQVVSGAIEVPVAPLNDDLRCAMCPFVTKHKPSYIRHLKSHMYNYKKTTTLCARSAALRRKFGYRRKRRKPRPAVAAAAAATVAAAAAENLCDVCNDDASGIEHMVGRCRRCGAFNLQWCDECKKGGYSTSCRLRHHETECGATPHTRCSDVPRVRVERLGPPLPLHCVSCDVTRILYVREKRCKQCLSQLLFKCEMCCELRDTFAELCGHVARAHIIGCLVQCNECGKNCEDIELHRRVCESQPKENTSAVPSDECEMREMTYFSEDDDSNGEMMIPNFDNLILELDEDFEEDDDREQIVEEV